MIIFVLIRLSYSRIPHECDDLQVQRAEENRLLAERKKLEEERKAKEAEEQKQRDADERRRKLEEAEKKRQAMMEAMKVNDVLIIKIRNHKLGLTKN